jgi:phosphohistidine phosphatase
MYEGKKLLLIMRHAKSDHLPSFSDFDRPLNERGELEPQEIAKQLNARSIGIDKAVISSARRTKETWDILNRNLIKSPAHIFFEANLYNAYCEDMIGILLHHASNAKHVLVIAHNPAVTEVCNVLSGTFHEFKPADLAVLSTVAESLWFAIKHQQLHLECMLSAEI